MEINKKTMRNAFVVVAGAIVLYWLLHETERVKSVLSVLSNILSPFLMGAAFAFILNVPMRAIEGVLKKVQSEKLRRVLAILLTLVAVLLVLAGVFWLLIPQLIETIKLLLPRLQTFALKAENFALDFLNENPSLMQWVTSNTEFTGFNWGTLVEKLISMFGDSVSTIVGGAFSAIGSFASIVVDVVIAFVFALYCLYQKEVLARQGRKLLYAFVGERNADRVVRILRLSNSTFSNFLSGQCVEVCILGSLFAVCMAILRMPYIPLVSVLVAVTAFIPVVGAFVGCFIGAFLILVANPLQAVIFVAMFLVLQQIENNLIYPRVVGTSIGLSGMWVLVAVAVGGELMGVAGMFLMIPFASVLYTLLRELTARRLANRNIDSDKLIAHPPELRSHVKEKRKMRKETIAQKKQAKKERKQ